MARTTEQVVTNGTTNDRYEREDWTLFRSVRTISQLSGVPPESLRRDERLPDREAFVNNSKPPSANVSSVRQGWPDKSRPRWRDWSPTSVAGRMVWSISSGHLWRTPPRIPGGHRSSGWRWRLRTGRPGRARSQKSAISARRPQADRSRESPSFENGPVDCGLGPGIAEAGGLAQEEACRRRR